MVLQPSVYEFVFTESAHSAKKGKVIVIVEACLNPLIVLNCVASRKIGANGHPSMERRANTQI